MTKCPRDDDGDYLDENGEKLTKTIIIKEPARKGESWISSIQTVETLENQEFSVHPDGFILIGIKGEKWCVRRDIFLETYDIEETK